MNKLYHTAQLPLFVLSKVCTKCKVEKPLEEFYASKTGNYKDGHLAQCKMCITAKSAEYHADHYEHKKAPVPKPVHGGKVCTKCHIEKEITDFPRYADGKDGYNPHCKECQYTENNERRYKNGTRNKPVPLPLAINGGKVCGKCLTERNLERFPKDKRSQDGLSGTCKECAYAVNRMKYATENKEQKLAKNHEWYEANRTKHRQLVKTWSEKNPLKINDYSARRRFRKHNATTDDRVDYEAIIIRDANTCYICEQEITPEHILEFDHVIPLARNGSHTASNIKITHMQCNRRKGDKLLHEMSSYQRRSV